MSDERPTILIFGVQHEDGSATMRYHVLGMVSPAVLSLLSAMAGPVLAEQILSAEDIKTMAAAGLGVTVFHVEAP